MNTSERQNRSIADSGAAPNRPGEGGADRLVRHEGWGAGKRAGDPPTTTGLIASDSRFIRELLTLTIEVGHAWQELVELSFDAILRSRFAGYAGSRNECAMDLQMLLSPAGMAGSAHGIGVTPRRGTLSGHSSHGLNFLESYARAVRLEGDLRRSYHGGMARLESETARGLVHDQAARSERIRRELVDVVSGPDWTDS